MIEEMIAFERITSQIGEDIFMCPSDYPYLYMNNEMTNILIKIRGIGERLNKLYAFFNI